MRLTEVQQRRITNEIGRAKEEILGDFEAGLNDILNRRLQGVVHVSEEYRPALECSRKFITKSRDIYLDILANNDRPINNDIFKYIVEEIEGLIKMEFEDLVRWGEKYRNTVHGFVPEDSTVLTTELEKIKNSVMRDLEIEKDRRDTVEDKMIREETHQAQMKVTERGGKEIDRLMDRLNGEPDVPVERKKDIVVPSFDFITTKELIPILQRDYIEIVRCMDAGCWKAAIILSGSCIEGILYDILKKIEPEALKSKQAQKDRESKAVLHLEKWDLNTLIKVALDLTLIGKEIGNLHDSAREYRNLIHPAKEVTSSYKIDEPEAKNFLAVLDMLIRDIK